MPLEKSRLLSIVFDKCLYIACIHSDRYLCFVILIFSETKNFILTGKSCISLQLPLHGNLSLSCGFSFGSQASFTCDRGYQLIGSQERLCKRDGSWSGNTTACNGNLMLLYKSACF